MHGILFFRYFSIKLIKQCTLNVNFNCQRKSMQENKSIMVLRSKLKILSLGITVWHHSTSLMIPTVTLVTEFSICISQPLMHQSFVTMTPTGMGNSGDTDFSLCKARVHAQHCGDIFMVKAVPKALLKSWYMKVSVKLPRPVWAWNQKPRSSKALRGYPSWFGHGIKSPTVPRHCRDNAEVKTWHSSPPCPWPHRSRGYKWLVNKDSYVLQSSMSEFAIYMHGAKGKFKQSCRISRHLGKSNQILP